MKPTRRCSKRQNNDWGIEYWIEILKKQKETFIEKVEVTNVTLEEPKGKLLHMYKFLDDVGWLKKEPQKKMLEISE